MFRICVCTFVILGLWSSLSGEDLPRKAAITATATVVPAFGLIESAEEGVIVRDHARELRPDSRAFLVHQGQRFLSYVHVSPTVCVLIARSERTTTITLITTAD